MSALTWPIVFGLAAGVAWVLVVTAVRFAWNYAQAGLKIAIDDRAAADKLELPDDVRACIEALRSTHIECNVNAPLPTLDRLVVDMANALVWWQTKEIIWMLIDRQYWDTKKGWFGYKRASCEQVIEQLMLLLCLETEHRHKVGTVTESRMRFRPPSSGQITGSLELQPHDVNVLKDESTDVYRLAPLGKRVWAALTADQRLAPSTAAPQPTAAP